MAVPNHGEIANRLYRAAENRTFERGVRFDGAVSSRMKGMADHGAGNILDLAKRKSSAESVERSVLAATRVGSLSMIVFVDEMADLRLAMRAYVPGENELREDLWTKVHDILCPIWPIC